VRRAAEAITLVAMEEKEHRRTEGKPRTDLFARSDETDRRSGTHLSHGGESGADLSVQRFVQELESDPAVAGADSPCQNLLGG